MSCYRSKLLIKHTQKENYGFMLLLSQVFANAHWLRENEQPITR